MGDDGNDDAGAATARSPAGDDKLTPEEGLELIQLFQGIRQRAHRRAALDIIRTIAMQTRAAEHDTGRVINFAAVKPRG